MPEAVIVDAIRTPIGRAAKGSLKDVRADDLAAVPLKALVERNPGVDFSRDGRRDDGLRLRARRGGLQRRPQRHAAGRASTITSRRTTVNRFCASSLQTIRMAFHAIKAGEGDQYIAAGVEAVSRFPPHPPFDPHPQLDGSEGAPYNVYIPMGLTAENVAERCQASAARRRTSGRSSRRTAPSPPATAATSTPRSSPVGDVTRDDGPRPGTTLEKLAELKPAFDPEHGHGHGRQLLPAQRRRGGRARAVAGEGGGARPEAARADRRLLRRRGPAGDHGPRPDPGRAEACSPRRA